MSEIPESLRGAYMTSAMNGLSMHVTIGAMTMGASISLKGLSMVLVDESTPDAKLHNITIVDGGKESESVTFNASDPDGKPDTGLLTLNKDGLTLDDHLSSRVVDLLMIAFDTEHPQATKAERDAAIPALTAITDKYFRRLTRSQGASGSLPLMVGGGAALILLLMVK